MWIINYEVILFADTVLFSILFCYSVLFVILIKKTFQLKLVSMYFYCNMQCMGNGHRWRMVCDDRTGLQSKICLYCGKSSIFSSLTFSKFSFSSLTKLYVFAEVNCISSISNEQCQIQSVISNLKDQCRCSASCRFPMPHVVEMHYVEAGSPWPEWYAFFRHQWNSADFICMDADSQWKMV